MSGLLEAFATIGGIAFILALSAPGLALLGMLAFDLWDEFGPARKR